MCIRDREAVIHLAHGEQEKIREKMNELKEKRTTKQPLEYPSAGSTFKRPEGYFAGKLIEEAGLRGFQVGGAQVSEKHCGFVINKDNATAAEVRELIRQVSERVKACLLYTSGEKAAYGTKIQKGTGKRETVDETK